MKKHHFSQDHIVEHYDDVAKKYDAIYLNAGYHDHEKGAELAYELFGSDKAKEAEVFDMGCGTGLVGYALKEKGFTKIAGVDVSQGMLDVAAQKNAYNHLKVLFLGKPETFPQEYRNRFDIITASGILAEGHLGKEVFDEMLLALK